MAVKQMAVYPLCQENYFQRNAFNLQFMNSKDCKEYFLCENWIWLNSWSILLLSHAAMRRKSHWLLQISQTNKLNRCKLSNHMFKFEANFYCTITRNKTNKSLQKNFPLKSGFCLACLKRNSYIWVETSL